MFWYHTPSLFPMTPDICWRCDSARSDIFYVFWDCPGIQPFWASVWDFIYRVVGVELPLTPLSLLLNVPSYKLTRKASRLVLHMLTTAKCLISAFWKCSSPPSIDDLYSRIKQIRSMEHLTVLLHWMDFSTQYGLSGMSVIDIWSLMVIFFLYYYGPWKYA